MSTRPPAQHAHNIYPRPGAEEHAKRVTASKALFKSHPAFQEDKLEEYMSYADRFKSQLAHAVAAIQITRDNPVLSTYLSLSLTHFPLSSHSLFSLSRSLSHTHTHSLLSLALALSLSLSHTLVFHAYRTL